MHVCTYQGRGLHKEVVDRHLGALLSQPLIQLCPCSHELVHTAFDGQVVVWDGGLGLQQPLGCHLADVGVGLICEGTLLALGLRPTPHAVVAGLTEQHSCVFINPDSNALGI